MPHLYSSEPSKEHHQILHSVINERVDVHVEAIDARRFLFSIAVAPLSSWLKEGNKGVSVALSKAEGFRLLEVLADMLGAEIT